MSDTNTGAPPPGDATNKPKRTHSDINQAWTRQLSEDAQVVATAQKTENTAAMTKGGITPEFLTLLAGDIAATQKKVAKVLQQMTDGEDITEAETEEKRALVAVIKHIQKRAKTKYEDTNPTKLKDYGVGAKWYNSRSALEQMAANLQDVLEKDTLPGVDTAKVQELADAADAYKNVQTEQSGSKGKATGLRAEAEAELKSIGKRRRKVQLCADAEWEHTNKANAGIRAEFKLPPNKPLS